MAYLSSSSSPSTPSSITTLRPPHPHSANGIRTPPLSPRPLPLPYVMRTSSPPPSYSGTTNPKARRSSLSRPPSRSGPGIGTEVRSPTSFSPMMALAIGLPLQTYGGENGGYQQQVIHRPQPLRPHSTGIGLGPRPPLSGSGPGSTTAVAKPRTSYNSPPSPQSSNRRVHSAVATMEIQRPATAQGLAQGQYQHSPISRPGTPLKREREREVNNGGGGGGGGVQRRSSAFRPSPHNSPLLGPSSAPVPPPLSRPGSPLLRAVHSNNSHSHSTLSAATVRSPRRSGTSRSPSLNRHHHHHPLPPPMKVAIPPRACSGTASTPSTFFSNVVATVTPGSASGTSSTIASPVPLPMGRLPGEEDMSDVLAWSGNDGRGVVGGGGDYFAWSTGVEDHWLNSNLEGCTCAIVLGSSVDAGECTCGKAGGERYDDGERARKLLRGCLEADEEERSARTSRRNSTDGAGIGIGIGIGRSRRGSFRSSPNSDMGEPAFFDSGELDLLGAQSSTETPPMSLSCSTTTVSRTAHSSTAESCSSYVSFSSLNCPPPSPPSSPLIGLNDGEDAAAAAAAPTKKKGWVWG